MIDMTAITAYSYIRFSTTEQLKGDSLRRQLELSEAYAAENGLMLDHSLNLRDLGVSAFKGGNVERGKLGAFIQAIDKGLVKPGSFLLVESLDRLARTEVLVALEVFLSIIRKGITIVTLVDKRVYSEESIRANFTELIISISVMSRAHDESLTKSHRRKASWTQSKKLAAESGKKITRKIPFWLSLPDMKGEFIVKEAESSVVATIFNLATSGFGYMKICQELNKKGISPPLNGKGWGTSTIGTILQGTAVLGHLQTKEGLIENYYPRIIDDELWKSAQPNFGPRLRFSNPRKSNLFTGLLYCGDCGGPMQIDTNVKDNDVISRRMLCQRSRRGLGCKITVWRVAEFEDAFFRFVSEVDIATLLGKQPLDPLLQIDVDKISTELKDVEGRIANLVSNLEVAQEEGLALRSLLPRIKEYESKADILRTTLKQKLIELEKQRNTDERMKITINSVKELYARMACMQEDELVLMRYAISSAICAVVERIDVYPRGLWTDPTLDAKTAASTFIDGSKPTHIQLHTRSFNVTFRNGTVRVIEPEVDFNMKISKRSS